METETGVKKCTIQVIPGYEGFDKGGVENTKETDQSNVQTGDNNFEVVAGDNMKGSGKEIKDRVVGLVAMGLGATGNLSGGEECTSVGVSYAQFE